MTIVAAVERLSPLRVALVTRSLMTGGAQRHVARLCESINPRIVKLHVFLTVRREPRDLWSNVQAAGVPISVSPYHERDPRVARWLARELARTRIDVVHSFLWTSDAFSALSDLLFHRAPLICSERGDRTYPAYSTARNLYDRAVTFRRARIMCANSRFGGNLLARAGCDAAKIRVIHNGVDVASVDRIKAHDIRREFGWPASTRIVGAATRLIDYKGVDTLIDAIGTIRRSDVRCVLVGDGPQRQELERKVASMDLGGHVRFVGTQHPSEPWIKGCDIAVLTTRIDSEHCSNSILEYMACARSVVATAVAGVPELVDDGVTGILVPRNRPDAVAEALTRLIDDPVLREKMGTGGRKRIEEHFRVECVATAFANLWREVAGRDREADSLPPAEDGASNRSHIGKNL